MKKNLKHLLLATTLISLLVLPGCANKFVVDISNMPAEWKANNEKILNEFISKYENPKDNNEKITATFEIGFRYMNLGRHDKAIPYYEEVLESNPLDFATLNNLARIYEEAEEIQTALEYQQKLYNNNSTNMQVIAETIRLLLKNNQTNDAQGVLETFARTEKGKEASNLQFVSDQFELIQGEKAKAQQGD